VLRTSRGAYYPLAQLHKLSRGWRQIVDVPHPQVFFFVTATIAAALAAAGTRFCTAKFVAVGAQEAVATGPTRRDEACDDIGNINEILSHSVKLSQLR
jgi:hypothetical protein